MKNYWLEQKEVNTIVAQMMFEFDTDVEPLRVLVGLDASMLHHTPPGFVEKRILDFIDYKAGDMKIKKFVDATAITEPPGMEMFSELQSIYENVCNALQFKYKRKTIGETQRILNGDLIYDSQKSINA